MLSSIEKWNSAFGAWFSTGDMSFDQKAMVAKAERLSVNNMHYRVITVIWES